MKYPEIAKRFRIILAEKNIKQQELSDKTGIRKSSISQYVNGTHCPSNDTATIIGEHLSVNPLWLMGLDDDKRDMNQISRERKFLELYSQLKEPEKIVVDKLLESLTSDK